VKILRFAQACQPGRSVKDLFFFILEQLNTEYQPQKTDLPPRDKSVFSLRFKLHLRFAV
jgi:hypothetical protein